MYTSRILVGILVIGAIGCKTASVSTASSEPYREDLSMWRPDLTGRKPAEVTNTGTPDAQASSPTGGLKYELDSVNQIMTARNKLEHYVDGYTIQVYTGNDRQAATSAMQRVSEINPELNPQIQYDQPSYKVKAGQYIDKLKAHEVYENLKGEFPLALLIPERIRIDYD